MQIITYYKVIPGGNATAIVEGQFPKETKILLAKAILAQDSSLEQVGFWVPTQNPSALARLEMMGGEFCGNALRALGALLHTLHQEHCSFTLESSGLDELISTEVTNEHSSIRIPLSSFTLSQNVCHLPGISHILTDQKIEKHQALPLLQDFGLTQKQASGVIPYSYENGVYALFPFVWVRDTETLYEETACASGTIALAYFLHHQTKEQKFAIRQPSQTIFHVNLDENHITLHGPFSTVEKKFIEF